MTGGLGCVDGISASGNWGNGIVADIRNMFYNNLTKTRSHVSITTYSMGNDNEEVNEFFKILEDLVKGNRIVKIIVNDDEKKNGTCSQFAKQEIARLERCYPDRFFPRYFKAAKNRILHAKLILIDDQVALVGSANISKNAFVSNYEVMLKVGNPAAKKLSLMFEELFAKLDVVR